MLTWAPQSALRIYAFNLMVSRFPLNLNWSLFFIFDCYDLFYFSWFIFSDFIRDYGGYLHEKSFNQFHSLLNCSHAAPNGDRYMKELRSVTVAIHSAKNSMIDLDKRVS